MSNLSSRTRTASFGKPGAARCSVSALLVLLLSACDAPPGDAERAEAIAPARVAVVPARASAFGERLSLSGTLTAERQARLSVRTDGLIARVNVDAGDHVEAGQVLLELDPAMARHVLLRTRAEAVHAAAAEGEAERLVNEARQLIAHQAISATEVESRAAALAQARAAAESVRASAREQEEIVARHTLPAPFSGVIAEKFAEAGEWVQRGTPVLSLVATDRVRLDLRVPQERFRQIDGHAQVRVFSDALVGMPLPASIGAQVPVADPGARTFLLRLLVDDPQGRLLPGTSARAEISIPQVEGRTVSIDRDALLRQPDGTHSLYVVEDGDSGFVARRRTVRVVHEHDGWAVVAGEGVNEGAQIVIRGNEALNDGQPVDVVAR